MIGNAIWNHGEVSGRNTRPVKLGYGLAARNHSGAA
jgi:hypothetical protein